VSRLDETVMLNTDILPKLNYVAMNWNDNSTSESRSPADMTSVVSAVNAAAMKYLDDRQLVQQAVAAANRGRKTSRLAQSSQQVATPSSNASVYGMKSANLSMASRKYFEKHQLGVNRAQPVAPEHHANKQMSRSQMEDLLNSISSQVNGLQVMASPKHSTQWTNRRPVCADGTLSDLRTVSSVSDESAHSVRANHRGGKSLMLSDTLLDETCIPRRQHQSRHRQYDAQLPNIGV